MDGAPAGAVAAAAAAVEAAVAGTARINSKQKDKQDGRMVEAPYGATSIARREVADRAPDQSCANRDGRRSSCP